MNPLPFCFRDRRHAGRVLASYLMDRNVGENPLVLALPRGGAPVGFEVAAALGAPLDVFLVRKIGLPVQPEFAMGSLASGGLRMLDHALIEEAGVTPEELARVTAREARELARREELYRCGRAPLQVYGREVIIVDDGLATGFTMRSAVAALRKLGCARITAAIPVGAEDSCAVIAREVDLLVCPLQPAVFHSVSLWYGEFSPTDDDEVRDCLDHSLPPCGCSGMPTSEMVDRLLFHRFQRRPGLDGNL